MSTVNAFSPLADIFFSLQLRGFDEVDLVLDSETAAIRVLQHGALVGRVPTRLALSRRQDFVDAVANLLTPTFPDPVGWDANGSPPDAVRD